jgi:hypothetical protein
VTLRETFAELVRHPVRHIVLRWHWKSALMSAIVRGLLFFVANLAAGPGLASRASVVEFVLRVPLVGALAAIAQLFSCATPGWAAVIVATTALPLVAHAAELAVHTIARTPRLGTSLLASVTMSLAGASFNLFAMRRGTLIVGAGARPFADDLKDLPRLIADFVMMPIGWATRRLEKANVVASTPTTFRSAASSDQP